MSGENPTRAELQPLLEGLAWRKLGELRERGCTGVEGSLSYEDVGNPDGATAVLRFKATIPGAIHSVVLDTVGWDGPCPFSPDGQCVGGCPHDPEPRVGSRCARYEVS